MSAIVKGLKRGKYALGIERKGILVINSTFTCPQCGSHRCNIDSATHGACSQCAFTWDRKDDAKYFVLDEVPEWIRP